MVTLSKVPKRLRGYLTRWLWEVQAGAYVGKVTRKVADQLWQIIIEQSSSGRASMVQTTNNEQGFRILHHHQKWGAKDHDGIELISRPLTDEPADWRPKTGWSLNSRHLSFKS